jgi:2-polyprenyl-3-methyl-5-hydroxy-6-metoxy-1,4-benzoquinol methylase
MSVGHGPGQGKPREPRRFDSTYLNVEAETAVHRDYAAHFFRWGFATRFCKGKRVLDAGCGDKWPLGQVLQNHGNMGIRAEKYVGVDVSAKVPERRTKFYDLYPSFDFTSPEARAGLRETYGLFDVVTSFEVIEHMAEADQRSYAAGLKEMTRPGGRVLISTPTAQGRPARNHIRELKVEELHAILNGAGLKVVDRFGTFGDVGRLRSAATDGDKFVMDRLRDYYTDDVLACFLAPLYPDSCKNNIHVCEVA